MAMFENFPYTDLHNLNLDWIIKIAKDFLDQYTHIQQLISDGENSLQNLTEEGLQQLQDKADALETLLNEWYSEHSSDIASQLADALEDLNEWYTLHQNYLDQTLINKTNAFDTHADQKTAESIATIPDDYTKLSNNVYNLKNETISNGNAQILPPMIEHEKVTSSTGVISVDSHYDRTDYIPVLKARWINFVAPLPINLCFYDINKTFTHGYASSSTTSYKIRENDAFVIFTMDTGYVPTSCYFTDALPLNKQIEQNLDFAKFLENELFDNGNIQIKPEFIRGSKVVGSTGVISDDDNYDRTDFIYTMGASTAEFTSPLPINLCCYDINKNFIRGVGSSRTSYTLGDDVKYIIFTIDPIDKIGTFTLTNATSIVKELNTVNSWAIGKNVSWIGDSIIASTNVDDYVITELMMKSTGNYGINGSTISLRANGQDDRNAVCERLSNIDQDSDIIIVSAGTNDFMYAWAPIGTIDSTEHNTFYGALKYICETLIANFPTKKIFFTTPIKRGQAFDHGDGGTYSPDGTYNTPFTKNKYGLTLGDYANIIKEVCGYYSIPVCDLYNECGLNPHIAAQQNLFDSELTHPTNEGAALIGMRLAGWLSSVEKNV